MRLLISLAAAIILGSVTLLACSQKNESPAASAAQKTNPAPGSTSTTASQTQTGPETPSDGVRRVTTVELREALEKDKAIVIDVRTDSSYKAGHIKGARLITAGDIASHINELPKDKLIVTYCS
jgi:3-mercaptopyruvate sulfurtransferase SseA